LLLYGKFFSYQIKTAEKSNDENIVKLSGKVDRVVEL